MLIVPFEERRTLTEGSLSLGMRRAGVENRYWEKLVPDNKYWTFVEYCGKISVIKERWYSDEDA